MKVLEPSTTLTDLILGLFSIFLALRLFRGNQQRSRGRWAAAIALSGLAALLGAASHGFGDQIDLSLQRVIWKGTTLSVGLASYLLFMGALACSVMSEKSRRVALAVALGGLVLYGVWMLFHDQFIFVIAGYATAMLAIVILQLRDLKSERLRAHFILSGIALSFGGAAVQASGFSLHQHMNQNDIYHLIQLVATYSLYRGGLLMIDRDDSSSSSVRVSSRAGA